MEDVYQFRNAAAIVRSVEACGFHHVGCFGRRKCFQSKFKGDERCRNLGKVEKMPNNLDSLKEIKTEVIKFWRFLQKNNATMLPDYEVKDRLHWFWDRIGRCF